MRGLIILALLVAPAVFADMVMPNYWDCDSVENRDLHLTISIDSKQQLEISLFVPRTDEEQHDIYYRAGSEIESSIERIGVMLTFGVGASPRHHFLRSVLLPEIRLSSPQDKLRFTTTFFETSRVLSKMELGLIDQSLTKRLSCVAMHRG
jgi:hypothetical protein